MGPSNRFSDAAYVLSAALMTSNALVRHVDFLSVYSAYLRGLLVDAIRHPRHRDTPLAGLRIVVDPGNGGGGFMATQVLGPLGADVSGEQGRRGCAGRGGEGGGCCCCPLLASPTFDPQLWVWSE